MAEIVHTVQEIEDIVRTHYENPDLDMLRRAFALAERAHSGQVRLTGHPAITHPIAVAYRLAQMHLPLNVVITGLLHDVVEDSGIEVEEIQTLFGDDVAGLVSSMTKLKKIRYTGEERYAENLRKMFLAMASDVRVVFIKFADRLHNLQTLYAQPAHKQERIAREVLEIYAPIAGRLGMGEMKGELEDLAFSYMFPKEYERARRIMEVKLREKGAYVSHVIEESEHALAASRIKDFEVHGRVKRLYSLYRKLRRHHEDLTKIYDIVAVRIVVQDVEECYTVLGMIHQKWRPLPGRVKDYISQPKPNGYQSLHTTVFANEGDIVEFQIRTREMHELAEYGVAAHWRYKETGLRPIENVRWMEELASIQKTLADKKEFLQELEALKIDVFKDRIFVFTPKGDVIDLPEGATPIDFAYAIHTHIGNTCVSAKINERLINLDTSLESGDIVEIITDKNRKGPNPDWLKFAKTRHAREKIKDATRHTMKTWLSSVIRNNKKPREKAERTSGA